MTGKIRLTGEGEGPRERLSATAKAGRTTVVIPKASTKDLKEVPQQIQDALEIVGVAAHDEVLAHPLIGGNNLQAPDPEELRK